MYFKICRLAIAASCVLTSCGPAEPLNMREEFGKGIMRLGVVPFYPLRESARLGQVYLADTSTVKVPGPSYVPTSVVLTNAAVPFMEANRAERVAPTNRYPCSSEKLGTQILTGQTVSYYQQPDCSAAGASDPAVSKTQGAAPPPANQVTINIAAAGAAVAKPAPSPSPPSKPPPAAKSQATSLPPLELVGFPAYSLASIENLGVAGSVPTAFASFLGAIGFNHTTSLQVQAEGVEVAALSAEDFSRAILKACSTAGNPFGDLSVARGAMAFADHEMRENAQTRAKHSTDATIRDTFAKSPDKYPYAPRLYMLRQVFYLRGIRYIYNDSRVFTAMAAAAVSPPAGQQAPALPNISMNVTAPQGASGQGTALAADVAALRSQIDALRSAVASNTNIQVGATYTRATARGIEMIDLFQRPLAFGYAPFVIDFHPERGLSDFCKFARGEAVPK